MDVRGTKPEAIPGQYIIGFKPGVSAEQRLAAVKSLDARRVEPLDLVNGMLVVDPERSLTGNSLGAGLDSVVAWVQPNYRQQLRGPVDSAASGAASVDDPDFRKQYHLDNTGQTGGTPDADVNAPEAWNWSTGKDVVVAVADTNVDINHPDLKANIWTNAGEIADNGRDDDHNGYVDDVHGWNFGLRNNRPQDGGQTHGTHVAGIIGAVANNGIGGTGVAPNVKIMPLAVLTGGGTTANAIKAFEYAVANGANVISNSWGNNTYEPALQEAVTQATKAGAMVVVAAGNENWDTGVNGSYPDNYAGSVAIAASDNKDRKASYSNRGTITIDVAAPGDKIHSTLPGGRYGSMSGTSMAAPVYSGIAALVKSRYPELTMKQVEDRIFRSVQRDGNAKAWNDLVASGGRVDADAALLPIATPSDIGIAGRPVAGGPVKLSWKTDTGNQRYDVEVSTNASARSAVDESFESGTASRAFRTSGDEEWRIGSDDAKDGSKSFQVSELGRSRQARLELDETLPEDTEVSFWYRAGRGQELSFFVDRNLQFRPTTSDNWQQFRAVIPAGEHTFSWLAAGKGGSGGPVAIDGLKIGAVSDATWQPVGTTDPGQTSIDWTPGGPVNDVAVRVRADNGRWKGGWSTSQAFDAAASFKRV